eukprot:scaffold71451_cov34-Prasinocladus_malaysianus.AAC.2
MSEKSSLLMLPPSALVQISLTPNDPLQGFPVEAWPYVAPLPLRTILAAPHECLCFFGTVWGRCCREAPNHFQQGRS